MLRVDITPYNDGVHRLALTPEAEALDLPEEAAPLRDVSVDLTLDVRRDRILVHLVTEALAELTCDRTLRPFDQPLSGQYSVLFGPERLVGTGATETYDEVRLLQRGDRFIDLTTVVRDTLLLDIPQRKVAPGAEDEAIDLNFGPADADDEAPARATPEWKQKLQRLQDDD
ncbi:YceD family protein [Salisaeta longa]|uniref:YceD family protein n=1 Tax=Salisaeta longa TaxID=503170 RepID=UPI000421CEF1|nr:DUF177 domain-containing protein [Salisaeta longa]